MATGINGEGYGEILRLLIWESESETAWSEFFGRLKARGLGVLELVVFDDHEGLTPFVLDLLEACRKGLHAVMLLPARYRKRIRTTNCVERLNEEIQRRERVIRIFPNEEWTWGLIGAVLMEIDEMWTT